MSHDSRGDPWVVILEGPILDPSEQTVDLDARRLQHQMYMCRAKGPSLDHICVDAGCCA